MSWTALARWAAAAVSAAFAAYALGLAYEGMQITGYSDLLSSPLIDNASAERAYDELPRNVAAPIRSAAARRLVQGDPAYASGWVEVAYAESLLDGRMTDSSEQALERSYAIAYFDRGVAEWRVRLALEHWDALTLDCRRHVLAEARVALGDNRLRANMIAQLRSVHSPEGRLAARLLLAAQTLSERSH